jgi:hypothetical protein
MLTGSSHPSSPPSAPHTATLGSVISRPLSGTVEAVAVVVNLGLGSWGVSGLGLGLDLALGHALDLRATVDLVLGLVLVMMLSPRQEWEREEGQDVARKGEHTINSAMRRKGI